MAVGVAKPNAQGQAIMRTEIKMLKAKTNDCPIKSHPTNDKIAKIKTTGTNTAATLSARDCMGALLF